MTKLTNLIQFVSSRGGRIYLTGGAVRNRLLGRPEGDRDYEVHGVPFDLLKQGLTEIFGKVSWVGKSFPVFRVREGDGSWIDFSLPRKNAALPRVKEMDPSIFDPFIGVEQAQRGRDFTIDAIYLDPLTDKLLDYVGGRSDLDQKILRHVDSTTFPDDPLRVLRAGRIGCELEFAISAETVNLCRGIDLQGLPSERLFGEWSKLLLNCEKPSVGIEAFRELGVLQLFPEISDLQGVEQDPQYHPEGDVYTHTLMVVDEAARLTRGIDEMDRLIILFGALCHDMGKPKTTEITGDGRISAHRHTTVGVGIGLQFLEKLTPDHRILERVPKLIQHHLDHLNASPMGDKAVRKLRMSISPHLLIPLIRADTWGRTGGTTDQKSNDLVDRLEQRFYQLTPELDPPVILGRHLIRLGHAPGPHFGDILQEMHELQLDGEFQTEEEGLKKLHEILES